MVAPTVSTYGLAAGKDDSYPHCSDKLDPSSPDGDNIVQNSFNTMAIKLGTMGVTIVSPSGDDGSNLSEQCGYESSFPAASPYVLTVHRIETVLDDIRQTQFT